MAPHLSRRSMLAASAATFAPWFRSLAAAAAPAKAKPRACILLWMPGGPTQHDTFDPGPGSCFGSIPSSVPGLVVGEHLPLMAGQMHHLALLRTMDTKDATHDSAVFTLSSGYKKGAGGVRHPHLGAAVAFEFADPRAELPSYTCLSVKGSDVCTPGYLGAKYAPFVTRPGQGVPDLAPTAGLTPERLADQTGLLERLSREFVAPRMGSAAAAQATTVDAAKRLMRSTKLTAFDLSKEADAAHELYGRTDFGRQCLQARRLVEAGVPFVQVACSPEEANGPGRSGWDTHTETAKTLKDVLLPALDRPMAALLSDLKDRGLLDTTLVVWMGEFGRGKQGVGHNSKNWTAALAGCGVKGGVALGSSAKPDGYRPIGVPDLFATIFSALGVDPAKEHMLKGDRPMSIVDGGRNARPVTDALA